MPTMEIEIRLRSAGHNCVAGIDEAGRGPLAGPVMAAAVILPPDFTHAMLNDSKQLTEKQREEIYIELKSDTRVFVSCAEASVEEIDRLNILRASHLAMERAVHGLPRLPDICIIDGLPVRRFPWRQEAVVKGDCLSLSIAAASVIAKVERDRHMCALAEQYPHYAFHSNKGYGTPLHLTRLREHGPCPLHRRSFQPVSQLQLDFGIGQI
jgi:ribonuclease HII